jgi:DNA-binding MarR family transcriptional regulator
MSPSTNHGREARALAGLMQRECLGLRAGRLHRLVVRRFEQALRPIGLTLSQMQILSALTIVEDPVKPAFVADMLSVERSTMSRNLSLLETKGLVTVTERSASGRSLAVTITDDGLRTLAATRAAWEQAQEALIADLGADVPDTLDSWLAELSAAPARS